MSMPEAGSRDYEDMVEFMKADLKCGMGYTKIIEATRQRLESEGRDMNKEFEKWKKEQYRLSIFE